MPTLEEARAKLRRAEVELAAAQAQARSPLVLIKSLLIFGLVFGGGGFAIYEFFKLTQFSPRAPAAASPQVRDGLWADEMQRLVASRTKDPSSAQFRGVATFHSGGYPVVCGEVNGKNSLGGYTGFQHFVASGDQVYLEEQMGAGQMPLVREKLCR
jgi:hypothetical protein